MFTRTDFLNELDFHSKICRHHALSSGVLWELWPLLVGAEPPAAAHRGALHPYPSPRLAHTHRSAHGAAALHEQMRLNRSSCCPRGLVPKLHLHLKPHGQSACCYIHRSAPPNPTPSPATCTKCIKPHKISLFRHKSDFCDFIKIFVWYAEWAFIHPTPHCLH